MCLPYTLSLVFILGLVIWRLNTTCGEGCKSKVRDKLLRFLTRWLK